MRLITKHTGLFGGYNIFIVKSDKLDKIEVLGQRMYIGYRSI